LTRWLRRLLRKPNGSSHGFNIQKTSEFKDRAEADDAVIAQLRSLGADTELPREVNHYFYFTREDSARRVERLLTEQGFAAEKRPAAAGPKKWCVFATHNIVVSTPHMDGLARNLERLAKEPWRRI
jgi:hypothetical protein